jgi:hypothetical protein
VQLLIVDDLTQLPCRSALLSIIDMCSCVFGASACSHSTRLHARPWLCLLESGCTVQALMTCLARQTQKPVQAFVLLCGAYSTSRFWHPQPVTTADV